MNPDPALTANQYAAILIRLARVESKLEALPRIEALLAQLVEEKQAVASGVAVQT